MCVCVCVRVCVCACARAYVHTRVNAYMQIRICTYQNLLVMMLVTFSKYRRGDIPEGPGSKTMITGLILLTLPSAVGSMRNDHMEGWDLPWRGLRVPDVSMGGGSPKEVFKKASPRRRPRSRRRGRSRSRRS